MQQNLHYPTPKPQSLNRVQLLDFDGVLGYALEEALFQMPMGPHDVEFIQKMAQRHSLQLVQESFFSARYICIQAALFDACIPIQQGPMCAKLITEPYYIITARTDRFAVSRVQEFIEDLPDAQKPIKCFHTDHLPKGQVIEMLLGRHPDTHYTFYDDNLRHVTSARLLRNDRLDVFHVDIDMEAEYTAASTFYKNTILELAL